MDNQTQFKNTMAMIASVYDKEIAGPKLQAYWMILGKYPPKQIQEAAMKHMEDPKQGTWMPKPADILKYINGVELNTDNIIAMARLKTCPLGIMAAIRIGKFDLDNQDSFYLKQRAEEVLQLLPEWKAKANNGEYSEHELRTMIKYDVNPTSPFHAGLLPPREAYAIGMKVSALPGPVQEEEPNHPVKVHTQEEKQAIINSIATIGLQPRIK